jgi:hypothetical protein
MRIKLNLVLFVILSAGLAGMTFGQGSGVDGAGPQSNAVFEMKSNISTLFALDPLAQSLCFRDSGPGLVFQTGEVRNRCSDLNFNSYAANSFSVGIEGGRQGIIIDIGTSAGLKARYRFPETVGNGQGFAAIDVANKKALILQDRKTRKMQELAESADLFSKPISSSASAPVKLGHIYLMRVTDAHDKSFEMFAKLLVIAHVPNESVTVRWVVLGNGEVAKLN